jgi:hypothetical protein
MKLVVVLTILVAVSLISTWRIKDRVLKDFMFWVSMFLLVGDILATAWAIAADFRYRLLS